MRASSWTAAAAVAAAVAVEATGVTAPHNYTLSPKWDIDAPPQTRHYTLTVTNVTGAPDGVVRPVLAINGQTPGPLIEANENDTLSIKVVNHMNDDLSMHWHGLIMNGSNWEDGVTGITQCPIAPGGSYTYNIPIQQFGTMWYHSHARDTLADGLVGPLVIHGARDPLKRGQQYEDDQVVFLGDWYHDTSDVIDAGLDTLQGYRNNTRAPPPDSLLINGVGQFNCSLNTLGKPCHGSGVPEIVLRPNTTTRLRFINGAGHATLRASIDEHPLTIIEADGTGIHDWMTDRITIAPGQRYSGVVTTSPQDAGKSFYLRSIAVSSCLAYPSIGNMTGIAIVRVLDEHSQVPAGTPRSFDFASESTAGDCVDPDFVSMQPLDALDPPAKVAGRGTFVSQFALPPVLPLPDFMMNNISFRAHPWDPLLHKLLEGGSGIPNGTVGYITEPDPEWYDMVLINLHPFAHPFHRHSNDMYIVASGAGNPSDADLDALDYNLQNPLHRDTITVPASSFVVTRVKADSAGIWALHCHVGAHLAGGKLGVIIDQPAAISRFQIPAATRALCNQAPPNGSSVNEPARRKRVRRNDDIELIGVRSPSVGPSNQMRGRHRIAL